MFTNSYSNNWGTYQYPNKKTTTTETIEYDASGNVTKRVVVTVTEDGGWGWTNPVHVSYAS